MKRIVLLITLLVTATVVTAQQIADFASKYMDACKGDSAVKCVTIGPKMMEQLTRHHDQKRNEWVAQAIQKLKTARIIMSSTTADEHYEKAEQLLRKYPKRFCHDKDYRNDHSHGTFYTRKLKDGKTVELIMLHADTVKNLLVIVNLTGDIDEEFTELLSKNLSAKK
ncbi:MAG: DUF4252 domain-containing protein [Prevotella sp.]|nr:DUF4252 domain-containing protein [Prevotella sp.]MDD5896800.1 DUF4252 domain-containing protein [Prevotellaceae bacterium]